MGRGLQKLLFPQAYLVYVDSELLGELFGRSLSLQRLKRHLRLNSFVNFRFIKTHFQDSTLYLKPTVSFQKSTINVACPSTGLLQRAAPAC
jgi:hypothetical protein